MGVRASREVIWEDSVATQARDGGSLDWAESSEVVRNGQILEVF